MLTRKQKTRLKAYIQSLKRSKLYSDNVISDLVKKKARGFNPATESDVDKFLSDEGYPPSDGNKEYAVEE